ncbi:unnamed protein product, partial [Mesorhabditis spiculigera]
MCSFRLLLAAAATCALIPSSFGQTCTPLASSGPCITGTLGGACDIGTGTCVNSDAGLICCPPGSVIAATSSSSTSTTTTPACVDKVNSRTGVSDCPARVAAGYCTRKYYKTLMKQQCRLSCGYCTSTSSSSNSTCADLTNPSTGVSDCTRLSYLCSVSAYSSVMAVQCRSTCGYC